MEKQHSFPVSILVDYQATPNNRWQAGLWRVSGLVAGSQSSDSGVRTLNLPSSAASAGQRLWTGFAIELHKDDAESYYFNIVSDSPRVFVIGSDDGAGEFQPLLATLSYDEAASYLESDETVEAVPMPAEVYRWVELFVLEHYVPRKKKKRKREAWKEDRNERPIRH